MISEEKFTKLKYPYQQYPNNKNYNIINTFLFYFNINNFNKIIHNN